MTSYLRVRRLIGYFCLPPGVFLFGLLAGLLLSNRAPELGTMFLWGNWVLLYLAHTSFMGEILFYMLDRFAPVTLEQVKQAQVIVVLTAGIYYDEQLDTWMLGYNSWHRMRYAASLQQVSGLPLLLTGGNPSGAAVDSEAEVMQRTLHMQQLSAKWVEPRGRNTAESARYTADILLPQGLRRIVLVTHAFHMPRSVPQFEQVGFEVAPAPIEVNGPLELNALHFLPTAAGLYNTRFALNEIVGRLWYWCFWRH